MNAWHNVYFKKYKNSIDERAFDEREDCEIVMMTCVGIDVRNPATFNAKNCVFSATTQYKYNMAMDRMSILLRAHLHIKYLGDYDECYFKCVANVFKDNLRYLIAVDEPHEPKQSRKLMIRQNILEGYNGISANDTVDSANKIYADT
eukprot:1013823_1